MSRRFNYRGRDGRDPLAAADPARAARIAEMAKKLEMADPATLGCRACGARFIDHEPGAWLLHLNYQLPKSEGSNGLP